MANSEFENIELYLNDELSSLEKEKFEERLEKETALREQFQSYKEIQEILIKQLQQEEKEKTLRKQLDEKQGQYFDTKSNIYPIKKTKKVRWLSAVSVAAAAIIILLLWSPWQQNVLNQYGQLKMTNPTVRGNEQNRGLMKVSQLFNAEDYKDALPLLDSLVQESPNNAQSMFYRGVTLLHLKRATEAQKDLKAVFHGQSIYRYEAAYFIALSYLQNGDENVCRTWLQKIPDDASIHERADKILKKIKN